MLPTPLIAATATLVIALATPAIAHAQEQSEPAAKPVPAVVEKVSGAIERGAKAAARGVERGARATEHGIKVGIKATAHGIERGAEATARFANGVAKKVESSSASSAETGS